MISLPRTVRRGRSPVQALYSPVHSPPTGRSQGRMTVMADRRSLRRRPHGWRAGAGVLPLRPRFGAVSALDGAAAASRRHLPLRSQDQVDAWPSVVAYKNKTYEVLGAARRVLDVGPGRVTTSQRSASTEPSRGGVRRGDRRSVLTRNTILATGIRPATAGAGREDAGRGDGGRNETRDDPTAAGAVA